MKISYLPPFLKWPGGKRWLMSKYNHFFPRNFQHYYEPFLGGGSAFFSLCPANATLSDLNKELVNLYQVMRDNYYELAHSMLDHQKSHCKEYYYTIRSAYYDDSLLSASRFLYLNRMCYNGMYRVNKAGRFNVPLGTKQNCIYDIDKFPFYSDLLKNTEIIASDFADIIKQASEDDFIFADPPYTISHNQNSFIKYNEQLFTWEDQQRLLTSLCEARDRGVNIIATNANFSALKDMYINKGFFVKVLERFSPISGRVDRRCKQEELIIASNPFDEIHFRRCGD